jgi:hypothetical protein
MSQVSLLSMLEEVPDFRQASGLRHPLAAILAQAVCAMLCGARSLYAIAQWGRDHGPEITGWLGFRKPKTPCVATLHRVFKRLDVEQFEAAISQWIEGCRRETGPGADEEPPREALAVDGKTLCGTLGHEVPGVHLLSAFSHRLGIPVKQASVGQKTNEAKAVLPLLKSLVLEGQLVTGDAMFTQREICEAVVAQGGDYLLVVKDNQPTLKQDIETLLPDPPPYPFRQRARSTSTAIASSSVG